MAARFIRLRGSIINVNRIISYDFAPKGSVYNVDLWYEYNQRNKYTDITANELRRLIKTIDPKTVSLDDASDDSLFDHKETPVAANGQSTKKWQHM
jgi:hypothetical protein